MWREPWTSNNKVISPDDFYCCLLPQCEALHTCRSGFPIAAHEIYFLVFHLPNKWKWPEMNMYLVKDLNHETIQYIDGFGWYDPDLDWNWWYFFALLRNFRFSFGAAGYCIDKSFSNPLRLCLVFVWMLSLVYPGFWVRGKISDSRLRVFKISDFNLSNISNTLT